MATILDFTDLESKHKDNKSFCKIVYAISHVNMCPYEHKTTSRIKSEVSTVHVPRT